MKALNNLIAVLCDPDGKCCIHGSDKDRRIIDESLAELAAALAAPQPEGDAERQERDMVTAYDLFSNLKLHGEYAALKVAFGSLWPAAFSHGFQTAKVIYKPEPQPVKQAADWKIRGELTALKCWHRLTEAEADELVVFTAMLMGATQ